MIVCLTLDTGTLQAQPLPDASTCTGYVAVSAGEYQSQTLTYPEANQLIGAVASLFVLVFIFRAVRKYLGF